MLNNNAKIHKISIELCEEIMAQRTITISSAPLQFAFVYF